MNRDKRNVAKYYCVSLCIHKFNSEGFFSHFQNMKTLIPLKRIHNIKYLEKDSCELKGAYPQADILATLNFKKFHRLTIFFFCRK